MRRARSTLSPMSQVAPLDAATVQAFCAGDEQAVRAVYRQFSGLVYSITMRVLGDRGLAEEATQQTFVQAWRHATRFDSARELAPWLATIARRVAIDIHRREARRPSTSIDDVPAGDPGLVTLPPEAAAAWEAGQIRLAIDRLPAEEQVVVRMQHLDGCTHTEIAEQLALPLGTVKSRSFRAHKSLARALAHLREDGE